MKLNLSIMALLIFMSCKIQQTQAQNLDELKKMSKDSVQALLRNNSLNDSIRWKALAALSDILFEKGDINALKIAQESLKQAYKLKKANYIATSLRLLGMYSHQFGDFTSALNYYQQAIEIAKKNELSLLWNIYNGLGIVAMYTNDSRGFVSYMRLAYTEQQKLPKNSVSPKQKASVLFNLSNAFLKSKQYDSASIYINKVLLHCKQNNDLKGLAGGYALKGALINNKGPETPAVMDSALQNMKRALVYAQIAKERSFEAVAALGLADVYREQGKPVDSQKAAELAFQVSKNTHRPDHEANALEALAWAYADQGDYQKSMKLAERAKAIRDSLFNTDKAKALAELQVKFDVRQQQQQLALLTQQNRAATAQQQAQRARLALLTEQNRAVEAEKQLLTQDKRIAEAASQAQQQNLELLTQRNRIAQAQSQTQNAQLQLLTQQNRTAAVQQQAQQTRLRAWIAVTAILAAALLAGVVLYLRLRRSRAQLAAANTEISQSMAEKEVLIQEIHHRVKNNLQLVNSLLAWQSSALPDPALVDVLQGSQARIQSMALVHEFLYRADNLAQVRLDTYLSELLDTLHRSYSSAQQPVAFTKELAPIVMEAKDAIPFGLLVNELVTNAYKHAFTDRASGHVHVALSGTPDQFRLLVADDGRGLPAGTAAESSGGSLGMQLVQVLAKQLKATVTAALNQPAGTRFEVVRA